MNWRRNGRNSVLLAILLLGPCTAAVGQETERRDTLAAAEIVAESGRRSAAQFRISPADLQQVIAPLGEADIIKYVQRLPGISFGMEGSSSFSVRGGNMGNNHVSLDGVTVYGITHLFGMTTTVPSEVVGETDFCTGGFGGDDGNLLASHIRLHSKEPIGRLQGSASVSPLMCSAQISAPVVKDRIYALVSARISPVGKEYNLIARKWIPEAIGLPEAISAHSSDLYGKISAHVDDKNTVSLSWFQTDDRYGFSDRSETARDSIGWHNGIALLRWTGEIAPRWTLSAALSRNHFLSGQLQERSVSGTALTTPMEIQSEIRELRGTVTVRYAPNPGWTLRSGVEVDNARFCPAALKATVTQASFLADDIRSKTAAFFGDIAYTKSRLHVRGAVRASLYHAGDGYGGFFPEWHLLFTRALTQNLSVEATYDHMVQFYHTLEGIPTGISTDMIVPSAAYAPPEKADQLYGGIQVRSGAFRGAAGGYWKNMSGLVFHTRAERFFQAGGSAWKEDISLGTGSSYGMELLAIREGKNLSGQIAYTLSKTNRQFSDINEGEPFPYRFNRTHILNADVTYALSPSDKATSHAFSVQFTFTSGHYETLQAGHYGSWFFPITTDLPYFSHPNNYRMPAYIRLDLSYHLGLQTKHLRHDLSAGVYNALNRHNAFSLTWDNASQSWKKLSILPILPNIRYRISF